LSHFRKSYHATKNSFSTKSLGNGMSQNEELYGRGKYMVHCAKEVRNLPVYASEEVSPESRSGMFGELTMYTKKLFDTSEKTKDPKYALLAAEIYEAEGLGNRKSVQNRLRQAVKYGNSTKKDIKLMEDYIKRNSETRSWWRNLIGGLERNINKVVFGFAILSGLFFGLNGITEAVVGTTSSDVNILGLCLLICGLLGTFFFWNE
jgi:hypothetical protein